MAEDLRINICTQLENVVLHEKNHLNLLIWSEQVLLTSQKSMTMYCKEDRTSKKETNKSWNEIQSRYNPRVETINSRNQNKKAKIGDGL